ncbi:MAG: hypothetical protein ABID45_02505 [Patescibacteria group bacterium]
MSDENKDKIIDLLEAIENAQANLSRAKQIIPELGLGEIDEFVKKAEGLGMMENSKDEKIVEGVFDGQNMIGSDGEKFTIPANYASKSKLVEGDILKLTIANDGSFVYKQIGPVERKRVTGALVKDDETGDFKMVAKGKSYKLILASVTYFKGEPGDEVIGLTPIEDGSKWAAVENIIKEGEEKPLLEDGTDAELDIGVDIQLDKE